MCEPDWGTEWKEIETDSQIVRETEPKTEPDTDTDTDTDTDRKIDNDYCLFPLWSRNHLFIGGIRCRSGKKRGSRNMKFGSSTPRPTPYFHGKLLGFFSSQRRLLGSIKVKPNNMTGWIDGKFMSVIQSVGLLLVQSPLAF